MHQLDMLGEVVAELRKHDPVGEPVEALEEVPA
jgi:hypothetical protein